MQTLHPTLGAGDPGGRLLITTLGESSPFSGSVFQLVIGKVGLVGLLRYFGWCLENKHLPRPNPSEQ